ncbi:hypothetical protein ACFZAR_17725 [Streptomyces sp. NPDC008222]|uniref:hypothetical protein n=1 Tax=Streptomyces sp. NPDC008222 TaxID=3364820 RepID=UPI0036E5AF43
MGPRVVKEAVRRAQEQAREGGIAPAQVADTAVALLPSTAGAPRPVINATGVLLHTNLGRASLSAAARQAVHEAAGPTDVELDLHTGVRVRRGRTALRALDDQVPSAAAVHVVNNGAAALVLAATALAAGKDIVISRGEMVEIGDGFRLPDLLVSTGARLREVGTTNRTTVGDYAAVIGPETGFVLKVHPSNFRVTDSPAPPRPANWPRWASPWSSTSAPVCWYRIPCRTLPPRRVADRTAGCRAPRPRPTCPPSRRRPVSCQTSLLGLPG